MLPKLIALVFYLALAGCALAPVDVSAPAAGLGAHEAYCLPFGMTDQSFLTWPVLHTQAVQSLHFIRYESGRRSIVVGWMYGIPVMFDPTPDNSRSPMMFNAQVLPKGATTPRIPTGPCFWYMASGDMV